MVLYFIGLGLNDEKDITLKGLEAVKKCSNVYLESYTSKLDCSLDDLEKLYGKKVVVADRELVEKKAEETILKDAKEGDTAFLVIGDVFGATTHTDLMLRAKESGIKVEVVHNASVLTAVGVTGLELYKFGKVTSIPFGNENVKTPVEVMGLNKEKGLHTLFLLDLHPLEDKFMTIDEAIDYLMKNGVEDQMAVGCAQLGNEKQIIKYGKLSELKEMKFDVYPQCLIIPGDLHFMEEDALELWKG